VRRRIFGLPECPISLFPHPEGENPAGDCDDESGSARASSEDGDDDEDAGEDEEEPAER
jgi:hypothetical protein